jgi:hypothetical protein
MVGSVGANKALWKYSHYGDAICMSLRLLLLLLPPLPMTFHQSLAKESLQNTIH